MYDELTRSDLQKMQEEINYRVRELRPQLIEEVQTARAFGDLSENYEYKCAKQAKNRNDSRIRYLERMIKTAKVIEERSEADTGVYMTRWRFTWKTPGKAEKITLVTTLRQDALKGLISKGIPGAGRCWATGPGSGYRCRWKTAAPTGCRFAAWKREGTTDPFPSAAFDREGCTK